MRGLRLLIPVAVIGLALLLALMIGLVVLRAGDRGGRGGTSGLSPLAEPVGRVAAAAGLADEQRKNAGLIISVAKGLGLPPKAWVVALATAMQESNLRNINCGD